MISKNLLLTGACLAALAFSAASGAVAQDQKATDAAATPTASPSESKAAPTKRGVPYRGKITAVDSTAKTFTITTKKGETRVFQMTDDTKIMKDGQPATMADVVADQNVRGQYLKGDSETMTAKSVMLGMKGKASKHKKMTEEGAEASPTPTATP